MRARALIALLPTLALVGCGSGENGSLVGAGSTLVAPLVAQWANAFNGATITYGAIGSGAGIAQITARTVDFGASDAPFTPDQASSCTDCVQLPWALAATLVAYNVNGAPAQLKLSGPVLADIYLGKVTHWNDKAIAALNPGANLPATKIRPVFRGDSSGDTYALSDFLAKTSPDWKAEKGVSTQIDFPVGEGGRGNEGVAAAIARTDGAVGYLANSYVVANKLHYALIRNQAGKFPVPGPGTIAAAAAAVKTIPRNNAISLTNPPASAPDAYPISTFSYVLFPTTSGKAKTLGDFIRYAIGPGQKLGAKLQFAPLPPRVVAADEKTLAKLG